MAVRQSYHNYNDYLKKNRSKLNSMPYQAQILYVLFCRYKNARKLCSMFPCNEAFKLFITGVGNQMTDILNLIGWGSCRYSTVILQQINNYYSIKRVSNESNPKNAKIASKFRQVHATKKSQYPKFFYNMRMLGITFSSFNLNLMHKQLFTVHVLLSYPVL